MTTEIIVGNAVTVVAAALCPCAVLGIKVVSAMLVPSAPLCDLLRTHLFVRALLLRMLLLPRLTLLLLRSLLSLL